MTDRIEELCAMSDLMIGCIPAVGFQCLTVEPTGHIHDNKHEDDPGMIEATFQHMKYHFNRGRGL